jgi:penicillin-binding protein 1C
MRDNWCIGFSDLFTVAVWIGNSEGDPMVRVSGTSGAAPVWRDVMLALHRSRPGAAPPRPDGIEHRPIVYADAIEPARAEYFVAGTAQGTIGAAPAAARRPRIANPAPGSVYALDPDIPLDLQRIRFVAAGAGADERLTLDGRDLGPAGEGRLVLPPPGFHRLALVAADGKVLDRSVFTVR